MKQILLFLSLIILLSACEKQDSFPVSNNADITLRMKMEKITICHFDSEEETWHSININENALNAHINHGDYVGECTYSNCSAIWQDVEHYIYNGVSGQLYIGRPTSLQYGLYYPILNGQTKIATVYLSFSCDGNPEVRFVEILNSRYNEPISIECAIEHIAVWDFHFLNITGKTTYDFFFDLYYRNQCN